MATRVLHGIQIFEVFCLKVHHPRIISVKFHWNLLAGFRGEDFLSNCSQTDTRTDARHLSVTIAHPEHVVLRWAENLLGNGENAGDQHFLHFPKNFGIKRKCRWPAFSPFPKIFSSLSRHKLVNIVWNNFQWLLVGRRKSHTWYH